MGGSFIDSTILLYVASGDVGKAEAAERVIAAGGIVSVQVLNEVAHVARRKMGMGWEEVRGFLAPLRALLEVRPMTEATHAAGLRIAERYGFSIWDAMILAAAVETGCERVWTEDLQGGMEVEGVRVESPFG